MKDDLLFTEKYRPKKIADCILPQEMKDTFQQFVTDNKIPNLLLTGGPGVGKTTVAMAMLEELNLDYIVINGSNEGRLIDTLRTTITNFASAMSLTGGRKYIIIDEADYTNAESVQPALRNFIEQFSGNCGFILTCNFENKIIRPLHSRMSVVNFKIKASDKPELAKQFMSRVKSILTAEQIESDPKAVAGVITKHFPDYRRVLNEIQRYSSTGKIDAGILSNLMEINLKELMRFLKEKKFDNMEKWVHQNADGDFPHLIQEIWNASKEYVVPQSRPMVVQILDEYQDKYSRAVNMNILMIAMLTQMMVEVDFK